MKLRRIALRICIADILEKVALDLDQLSQKIFHEDPQRIGPSQLDLRGALRALGRNDDLDVAAGQTHEGIKDHADLNSLARGQVEYLALSISAFADRCKRIGLDDVPHVEKIPVGT